MLSLLTSLLVYLPVILRHVSKQIHRAIEMGNGNNFSANIVVDAVHRICVDETIANPKSCTHQLVYFAKNLR